MIRYWFFAASVIALLGVAAREAGWIGGESARGLSTTEPAGIASPESAAQVATSVRLAGEGVPAADPPQAAQDPGSRPVGPMTLERMLKNSTPSQKAVVEDGWVTLGERNAALLSAQECTVIGVSDLDGVVVKDPLVLSSRELEFGGFSAPSREQLLRASEVHRGCVFEYWADVSSAWTSWASEERLWSLWAEMETCMKTAGATPPEGANWEQLLAASLDFVGDRSLYDRCRRQAEAP